MDTEKVMGPNGATGGFKPLDFTDPQHDHSPEGSNIESYENYDSPHPRTPGPGTPLGSLTERFSKVMEDDSDCEGPSFLEHCHNPCCVSLLMLS
jgi:hypothetical protein